MAGGNVDQPYLGEIVLFAGYFPPSGWMFCDGAILAIADYETLFNLIGTTYGGDGQSTFALPDLRSRAPVHYGTGSGGAGTYALAQTDGAETVTLTINQIPSHSHAYTPAASSGEPTTDRPDNAYPAVGGYYAATTNSASPMPAPTVASAGGNQPHDNLMPYVAINFIISLFGVYPSPT